MVRSFGTGTLGQIGMSFGPAADFTQKTPRRPIDGKM
jgi:hypothetical protein